jgi:hypothetical protein
LIKITELFRLLGNKRDMSQLTHGCSLPLTYIFPGMLRCQGEGYEKG